MMEPLTIAMLFIMGVLYVDNTDLFIMQSDLTTAKQVWVEAQKALDTWGALLIATGGMLKPEKCFSYIINYVWEEECVNYAEIEGVLRFTVPQADRKPHPIKQLSVYKTKKVLGIWTNPEGCGREQLKTLRQHVEEWTNRLRNGHLPARWAWVSYFRQLWPKIKYGLGTNTSPVEELIDEEETGGGLQKIYRKMLPHLGVNRNIKVGGDIYMHHSAVLYCNDCW